MIVRYILTALALVASAMHLQAGSITKIHGSFLFKYKHDSVSIVLIKDISQLEGDYEIKVAVKDNTFHLDVPLDAPAMFYIQGYNNTNYFLEAGDNIGMTIAGKRDSCMFSGDGAARFRLIQKLSSLYRE